MARYGSRGRYNDDIYFTPIQTLQPLAREKQWADRIGSALGVAGQYVDKWNDQKRQGRLLDWKQQQEFEKQRREIEANKELEGMQQTGATERERMQQTGATEREKMQQAGEDKRAEKKFGYDMELNKQQNMFNIAKEQRDKANKAEEDLRQAGITTDSISAYMETLEQTKPEALDAFSQEVFGKPFKDITPLERNKLERDMAYKTVKDNKNLSSLAKASTLGYLLKYYNENETALKTAEVAQGKRRENFIDKVALEQIKAAIRREPDRVKQAEMRARTIADLTNTLDKYEPGTSEYNAIKKEINEILAEGNAGGTQGGGAAGGAKGAATTTTSAPPEGERPPVQGAKKAQDGFWYVMGKNGKWNKVIQ